MQVKDKVVASYKVTSDLDSSDIISNPFLNNNGHKDLNKKQIQYNQNFAIY